LLSLQFFAQLPNPNPAGTGFKPEIKASFPEFSKKPIEQLTIHEGQNLMIMLSGATIALHCNIFLYFI
jgi:hypothetical protein